MLKAILSAGLTDADQKYAVLERIFYLLGQTALICEADVPNFCPGKCKILFEFIT